MIRRQLRRRGIKTVIPEKRDSIAARKRRGSTGGRPPAFDAVAYRGRNVVERSFALAKQWRGLATRYDVEVYKARNVVERCFNALKHKRGVATRYDKLAVRFETTVRIANIDRWLKRLS